jgi:hypothetical protein
MLKQALRPLGRVAPHSVAAGAVVLALVPHAVAASVNVGTAITAGAMQLARQTTEDALAQAGTATSQIPGVAQSGVWQTLGAANATSASATGAPPVAPVASSSSLGGRGGRRSSASSARERRPSTPVAVPRSFLVLPATGSVTGAAGGGSGSCPPERPG